MGKREKQEKNLNRKKQIYRDKLENRKLFFDNIIPERGYLYMGVIWSGRSLIEYKEGLGLI